MERSARRASSASTRKASSSKCNLPYLRKKIYLTKIDLERDVIDQQNENFNTIQKDQVFKESGNK